MDQQEFADRTEAIKTRLYRTAYLYLGSEADALEAVDETVYRALRRLKQLQTPALFETWITRILINTCQDELRRRRRFHPGGADALPDTAGPDDYEHLPLREAIRRLPEELRQQVPLMKEVLTAMGVPIVERAGYEADDIIGRWRDEARSRGSR